MLNIIPTYYKLKRLLDSLPKSRTRNRKLFLLHDSAPVHTASRTQQAISDLGFTVCRHPPYSSDLAPSDFYLFGFLKKILRGVRFESEIDVETEVRKFLNSGDSESSLLLLPKMYRCQWLLYRKVKMFKIK